MDRMLYVAMSGAKQILWQQAATAHNLANVHTNGYRAETHSFRAIPVVGDGAPTRTHVVDSSVGTDFKPGVIQQTGRDLDVAVQGQGWIAVQLPDGSEAYTRNGSLQMSAEGLLQTSSGLSVLGDGGPISIPPDSSVMIAKDGTVSAVPGGQSAAALQVLGRIKLTNPEEAQLKRGDDGLFRLRDGGSAPADANVNLVSGAIEGSNVNVVEAMVNMITLARAFDMHIKLIENAESNERQASTLLGGAR